MAMPVNCTGRSSAGVPNMPRLKPVTVQRETTRLPSTFANHVWSAPQRALRRHLKPTSDSWRVDETYIRIKGKWRYLYRAVDTTGATLDFLLSAKQDAAAAKRFLAKALGPQNHPAPRVINTEGHPAYPR